MISTNEIYSTLHPMAPLGGLFVGVMGVFIILGAWLPGMRMKLTYIGFAAGMTALFLGGKLAGGLPAPSTMQLASLILAIILEIAGFVILIPRVRSRGERAVLMVTLAIVGAHFVVMWPAFGFLIALLGFVCLLNSGLAWRLSTYPIEAAWFVDGVLKLAAGVLLVSTAPALG